LPFLKYISGLEPYNIFYYLINMQTSELPGFHKLSIEERVKIVANFAKLSPEEVRFLTNTGRLSLDMADKMSENVIGTFELPFGIATNFLINGKDYLIPMAIEEPSVIAAASHGAKLARPGGGFSVSADPSLMVGQIQIVNVEKIEKAKNVIIDKKYEILEAANSKDSVLVSIGGGAKDIETNILKTKRGQMLIVNLIVDVKDAMGANAVNTMVERIAPKLEEITGGRSRLRIISNLADRRLARARAVWLADVIGKDTVEGVLDGWAFAVADRHRCATHNKGIMNGIDAVGLATGQDWRALEAGAHSFAAVKGYKPLTKYYKDKAGNLVGEIELPIAVGIVGGSTKTNPIAQIALKILGVKSAQELAGVMAAVGLAQNFAALRALSTEGIQRGHMKLHARNIALAAGAKPGQVDQIVEQMVKEGRISIERAKELINEYI
jgi:hydroxymethylglutaryl-CoA reductase